MVTGADDSTPTVDGGDAPDAAAVGDAATADGISLAEPGLAATFFKRYFEPRAQSVVTAIDFDWGTEGPGSGVLPNYFALRLTGELHAEADGTYGFRADVDDGIRIRVGDSFVAYFTANDGDGRLAIGAAVADSMAGPLVHQPAPLVTHTQGVIDATYFRDDDGRHYLIYKIDGNAHGLPTPNYIRELRPDGLGFAPGSSQTEILRNDPNTWEGPVAEAPWLHKRNGRYYLFYSGNGYNYRYRTGVARADAVTGPYLKHGAPILANNSKWVGPGHGSIVEMGGMDYWVYHAWPTTSSGEQDSSRGRLVMVDRIDWANGWPYIEDDGTPSMSHRPRPGVAP